MKGALKIGTFAKIPIFLHWSIAFILGSIFFLGYKFELEPIGYLHMALFSCSMYILVILHEYGHALMARKYGVNTKDIIISPIGGIARLERIPEKPMQEFYVAIAGPAVNLFIALLIFPILYFVRENGIYLLGTEVDYFSRYENLLPMLFYMNGMLALFNLVPAFPMDGGRVLRALLSLKLGRVKATRIASIVGQIIAVCFFVYGIYVGHLVLPFIAVFVFLMARNEYRSVKIEDLLNRSTAADIVQTDFQMLKESDLLSLAKAKNDTGAKHFLVKDEEEEVSGILPLIFLKEAVNKQELHKTMAEYKSSTFEKINKGISLRILIDKFQKNSYSLVPVYDNEVLIGVIDIDSINNFINRN